MKLLAGFYDNIAFSLQVRRKDDRALHYYKKAHESGCANPRFYASYAGLLLRMGEYLRAYEVISEGIATVTLKPKAKMMIKSMASQYVISLWKLGRLDEAIAEMERVHEEMPTGNSFGTLGYFYIERADKTGDYEQALAFNREAVDYDDHDSVILDNIGQVLYRLGKLTEAEQMFTRALEEKETQLDSLYYMAKVQHELNHPDKARFYIKKAMAQNRSNMATVSQAMVEEFALLLNVDLDNDESDDETGGS